MTTQQGIAVRAQAPGMRRRDWRHDAYCRDLDPEEWFGTGDSTPGKPLLPWETVAKRRCQRHCPVLADCRAWALRSGQEFGVAGGMAAQERRAQRPAPVSSTELDHTEDAQTRTVRQLAATGLSDAEIGARIGRSVGTVRAIRRRAAIPPGVPPGVSNRRAS